MRDAGGGALPRGRRPGRRRAAAAAFALCLGAAAVASASQPDSSRLQGPPLTRPVLLVYGGYNGYAMEELNRAIGRARTRLGTQMESVTQGLSAALEVSAPLPYGWSGHYRYEALPYRREWRTPSRSGATSGVGHALTVGVSYPLIRFGPGASQVGAALGPLYYAGSGPDPALSVDGNGVGLAAQVWAGHRRRIAREAVISFDLGFRYAPVTPRSDDAEIFNALGQPLRLDFTGVFLRAGLGRVLGDESRR